MVDEDGRRRGDHDRREVKAPMMVGGQEKDDVDSMPFLLLFLPAMVMQLASGGDDGPGRGDGKGGKGVQCYRATFPFRGDVDGIL